MPDLTPTTSPGRTHTSGGDKQLRRRVLSAASVGQLIEWYDFALYGYAVPTIAHLFFPESSSAAALLSSLAIYGVAFVMRPLGGIVFGRLGDRLGRQVVLAAVLGLAGVSTAAIGVLPTYASIGVFAPLLLLVCRLLQGFSAGGEAIGASSFAVEHAPGNRRATWVNLVTAMSVVPPLVATVFVGTLSANLTPGAYESWGWRIPFLVALPLALVGLFIRLKTEESPVFKQARETGQLSKQPLREALRSNRAALGYVFCFAALAALAFYLIVGYLVTYLTVTVGLTKAQAMWTNAAALVVLSVLLPVGGRISDRVGRRPMLVTGSALLAVVGYLIFVLASGGGLVAALAAQLLLVLGISVFGGAAYTVYIEMFPTATRFTGAAMAYNLAYALFGGTAPLFGAWLVAETGSPRAPGVYLTVVALAVLAVAFRVPETSKRRLD
ncbi:MFS transporter [Amycolatopsis taiwanensis]|uniref:MFS transporter n=1 Tax=Amycolatopsis taiwanensis TaxID=342230 RepID=UPI0004B54EB9|nr:MFS transporter [Amycolatopsis taiwanensis]